jgi:uncharacterized protein
MAEIEMSNPENARSPLSASPRPPRTLDFVETLLVALIADGVFLLTSGILLSILLYMHEGAMSPAHFGALWLQGNWQGVRVIVGSPPTIAVLWLAVREARRDFAEYLALNWPSRGDVLYAFALMAMLFVAERVVVSIVGPPKAAADYLTVEGAGGLFVLLIAGCIVGPIMEEFVVRGVMFRGWSESFLGPIGAIVLTSALWAMNHTQYDWFWRLDIFATGLMLGYLRWRSNSTWLTVMTHSANNTLIFFMTGPYT